MRMTRRESSPLRVFVPSKDRAETITTHQVFPEATVVVHTEEQACLYRQNPTLSSRQVVVSGVPGDTFGLTRQREWIARNLVNADEWFVFADDNIRTLTAVDEEHYAVQELPVQNGDARFWKATYQTECQFNRFARITTDTVVYAESVGARLCGFALVDNPYFRGKKFRPVGYVIGKLMLMKNAELTFNHTISMEDFRNTADHLLRFGAVVVNNFLFPVAGHYEKGGMGTYQERIEVRKRDVQRLLAMYPGLFHVKDREGFKPNTDLQLRLHSTKQVKQWRAELIQSITCKKKGGR